MLTYGIDVSPFQSEETPGTWPGAEFAFIKATEGHTWVSPVQSAQAEAARKAGRAVGFYHFMWPGNIELQAEWFVTQCASVPGDVLAIDWETCEDGSVPSCADKDALLAAVKRLRPNHRVILYCNRDFWLNRDTTSGCQDGLWIADYAAAPGKPGILHPWVFHQYSDANGMDRDVWNGSSLQLHNWMHFAA